MPLFDENLPQHFAAIVEGSNDAIVTKDLSSIILSWNPAAERMFGYRADEVVGHSITLLIPEDRLHEEVDFIDRLRRGERIQHFETIRRKKNGELFPVSVSISPIRDRTGKIIGASKIARDITAQHRATERQRMLLSEMRHRVGNSFAIAGSLLRLCANQATSVEALVDLMRGRFVALAAAHSMTSPNMDKSANPSGTKSLQELLEAILEPFTGSGPVIVRVDHAVVDSSAVTPLALVFYELCTNSVKYGALSRENGRLAISIKRSRNRLIVRWTESFANAQAHLVAQGSGFGTTMCESTVRDQLDGSFIRKFTPAGMQIILDLNYDHIAAGV